MRPLLNVSVQVTVRAPITYDCADVVRYPALLTPFYGALTALWWAAYSLWSFHFPVFRSRADARVANIVDPIPVFQVMYAASM